MKKKKIFLACIGLIALMLCLFTKNVYAEENTYTINDYKQFLQTNAPQYLSEFENLDVRQQQEVVDKILDPNTYREDSFIEKRSQYKNQFRSVTNNRSVWGRHGVYIGDFALLEYEVGGTYASKGGNVTKIYSSYAIVTRNLSPMTQISGISRSAWIQNGNFNLQAKFDYKVGPIKGLSVQLGVINAEFASTGYGTVILNDWYRQ